MIFVVDGRGSDDSDQATKRKKSHSFFRFQRTLAAATMSSLSVEATPRRAVATQRLDVLPMDAQDVVALAPYFDMPVRDVQRRFGMSEGAFVRAFRYAGIPRWPYRRVRAMLQAADRLAKPAATDIVAAHERALLLHEHDFVLRNPELLALTVSTTHRRSSCTVLPLAVNSAPFTAPVTATQLSAIQTASDAHKVSARRKRDLASASSITTISTAMAASSTTSLGSSAPAAAAAAAAASSASTAASAAAAAAAAATRPLSQRRRRRPTSLDDDMIDFDDEYFVADDAAVLERAASVPRAPGQPPALVCSLVHQHEPLCFISRAMPSSAIVLPPLVVQSRVSTFPFK